MINEAARCGDPVENDRVAELLKYTHSIYNYMGCVKLGFNRMAGRYFQTITELRLPGYLSISLKADCGRPTTAGRGMRQRAARPEKVWRAQHGPACASTLTEPRSGDSKQGQDDTERSEVSACYIKYSFHQLYQCNIRISQYELYALCLVAIISIWRAYFML